jgi:hypothetical protein
MAFTLVIPDVSFLGHEWQELADRRSSRPSAYPVHDWQQRHER